MTVFKKIIDREIPADIVYEDELCLAFRDVRPQAPVHILVIPKKEIPSLAEVEPGEDEVLLGQMLVVASRIAREQGLEGTGYRTVINTNGDAGQTVFHLHLHILGGHRLNPQFA